MFPINKLYVNLFALLLTISACRSMEKYEEFTYYHNPLVVPLGNTNEILIRAIKENNCDVVRLVLSLGKEDILIKDSKGKSATDYCFENKCSRCRLYFCYYEYVHGHQPDIFKKIIFILPPLSKN